MDMKKIFAYILGIAAAAALTVSCDRFLDTESPSTYEQSTVFSNYGLAENAVLGVSEIFAENNSYRNRFLMYYGFNTDIEWYNTFKPTEVKTQVSNYAIAPNNSELNLKDGPFPRMYQAIERANLAIEGLQAYGDVENKPDMAYLLAEVKTLRAMIYYDLVKTWGDVPARFSSVSGETIYMAKSNRDVIFKQILNDLDEAIPHLPNPGETAATSRTDRVNKVFAEGLFARIALAAAGKAQRPADDAIGTGDVGTNRVSSDPDLTVDKLYRRALTHLENAIGKASLEDFEQYWRNFNNFDNMTAGPAFETLYVIPFSDSRGRWHYAFAVRSDGSSYTNGASRGGDTGPVPTFWFQYDEQDVRRDITCVNWKINADDTFEPAGIAKWYFGKYRYDWMVKHPYDGNQTEDGAKPVVMRYADILLMAAEIANELGDLNAAKGYFLPVRERAFKGHEEAAEAYVNGISSKEAMFNAIVDERAFEFCGEMLRKGDLIRWGLLKSKMDEAKAEMFKLRDLKAPYDYMSGDVYFQITDDPSEFTIYGLHRGETLKPSGDWEKKGEYITKTVDNKGVESGLYDDRINGIYMADPEQHMFWPIFFDSITNSQGYLQNDYGYDNP